MVLLCSEAKIILLIILASACVPAYVCACHSNRPPTDNDVGWGAPSLLEVWRRAGVPVAQGMDKRTSTCLEFPTNIQRQRERVN